LEQYPDRVFYDKETISGGMCKCDKIRETWEAIDDFSEDMLMYSYSENGSFWTGAKFGCVHYMLRSENQRENNEMIKRNGNNMDFGRER